METRRSYPLEILRALLRAAGSGSGANRESRREIVVKCAAGCIGGENRGPDLGNGLAVRCKLAELELAFLDSPNELDPCNRGRRVCEQLRPKHRPSARLDASAALLHDIVEIPAGAHPGTAPSRMFAPKQPQGAVSRPVRIKCDDPRQPIIAKRLAKELLRGLDVAMLAQAKVDRPAVLVDCAIQVNPLLVDFDVGFIMRHEQPTGRANRIHRFSNSGT
jgi:hypothetical protein